MSLFLAFIFLPSLWDFCIFIFFFVFSVFFSFFLSLSFIYLFILNFFFLAIVPLPFSLFTTIAFNNACWDKISHFYLSTTFGSLWASFQDCSLACWLPRHHHYIMLAVPCLIPKQKWFCFVSYLS